MRSAEDIVDEMIRTYGNAPNGLTTVAHWQNLVRNAQREAIESAAAVADALPPTGSSNIDYADGWEWAQVNIAATIRTLIPTDTKEPT